MAPKARLENTLTHYLPPVCRASPHYIAYMLEMMRMKPLYLILLGVAMTAFSAPKITVQGHRGARSVLPENTMPAFEYAIEIGADLLELDISATKDDVLVVHHDQAINKTICTGPEGDRTIRNLTLAQVKEFDCGSKQAEGFPHQQLKPGTKVPTLDEVLALAPRGQFQFNIEIKSNPKKPELAPEPGVFARMVVDAVRKHKLESRVVIQSFDWRTLKAVKAIAPDLTLAALYGGLPKDFVDIAKEAGGVPIVSPHYLLVTKAKVRKAHAAGLRIIPWTPNEEGQWKKLIGLEVDSIITDDPAGLIDYLKKRGLR